MTHSSTTLLKVITIIFSSLALFMFLGCGSKHQTDDTERTSQKANVSDNGARIIFPVQSPGLKVIKTLSVKKGPVLIPVIAPARVVASAVSGDGEKVILFDSPDVASLYSQYKQAKANVELTAKSLRRVKDMFETHAATEKDINQAEADAANGRATKAEYESKLRAGGFRYPDKKFIGYEEAMGDVVDPVTRTVKVRVRMKNPGGKFLPGMFARVDFGDPEDGVILLPASAVVTVEEKDFVFVETAAEEFSRRQVSVVNTTDGRIVVRKGLEEGEHVVVEGAMLLKGLSFGF